MARLLLLSASALMLVLGANAQAGIGVKIGGSGAAVNAGVGASGVAVHIDAVPTDNANVVVTASNVTWASARYGYTPEDESTINGLISNAFNQFYTYTQYYAYFEQDQLDLHGFAKFFKRQAMEEKKCAFELIKYQTKRGGVVAFNAITAPTTNNFGKGLDAFQAALASEESQYDAYIAAYNVAMKSNDPDLAFMIEEGAHKQTKSIKEIAGIVRDLQRANVKHNGSDNDFGEYKVDKELHMHEKMHQKKEDDKKCKKHHKKHGKHYMKDEM